MLITKYLYFKPFAVPLAVAMLSVICASGITTTYHLPDVRKKIPVRKTGNSDFSATSRQKIRQFNVSTLKKSVLNIFSVADNCLTTAKSIKFQFD